ncbi:MAG: NAD(P)-dependent oxidoreductase [Rhodoplanes sp.]|uniref:NAD(P)-dependent oxidoreductase n=1 Tax=Rhodoplanes sp. TaxID=1968906 RepID=UPI001837A356|nr:NAD(P)-dependent oxidoreductase [Rhodoplanes sp.]NVO16297.1 NAD(P)-dependent oxidoreductase [Rhodoplanes sp.]
MKPMLELLLFGLATILRRSSKNPLVQAKLRDRKCAVQVRTRDNSVGRSFVFCGGAVFSQRGVLANPDVSLVWKDAAAATCVLRSSDLDALQKALADEWLSIIGNGEVATWFGDLVRSARNRTPAVTGAKPSVAVIGLGRMGSGIARSLLRAGFPVTVYNRTEEKTRPLVEAGATAAATPAAAARGANFVITSLMGDASVFAVVEGTDGILAGLGRDAVHIGASTISADATRRLVGLHVGHGSEYLAAPVLGRPDAASAGELVGLVCGKQSVFEASRGIIQSYTRQIQYLGEDHAVALAMKLAVNYSAAIVIDLMGQVYAFGEKSGIPLTVLHTMFRMLWAQPVLQGYATRIWRRDFDDLGFDLRGGLKDLTLMVDAAKEMGVRWDFAELVQRKMARGVEMGLGQKDWSSVYEVTRAEAGLGT